ncbi:Conserved_hypothetical protein [Hexamita inflata]|uniref:Uncharacterized protein n=1 Tax=Hexamita inflata TaxID=28002 RepID=A0AA86PWN9_9EUKA|nr:Conserved hypothetical protein [Hexamita inflata]
MQQSSDFLIINLEYESRTAYEQFSSFLVTQQIPKLYCLDLNKLNEIPEQKLTKPTTLSEKMIFIRDFMDKLAVIQQDPNSKPKAKKQLDLDLKTDKTIILVSNFGFGEQVKNQIAQLQSDQNAQFTETLTNFINEMNKNFSENEQYDMDQLKFPEYPEAPLPYQVFADAQLEANIVISAYVQILEDFNIQEVLKELDFSDFLNKLQLTPPKLNQFQDAELFSYQFNPYVKKQILPLPKLFATKINNEPKKKAPRIIRDSSIIQLTFADGSVNFPKLVTFLRENKYSKINKYDVDIKVVPFYEMHQFSKYQTYYTLYKQLKQQTFKDDKAFQVAFSQKSGELVHITKLLEKFVNLLNILLDSPVQYKVFSQHTNYLNTEQYDQNYFTNKEQDFRLVSYVNVVKGIQPESARIIDLSEKKQAGKKVEDRVLVQCTRRFSEDQLNYLHKFHNEDKEYCAKFQNSDVFMHLNQNTINSDMSVYYASLNCLNYKNQNRLGSIMEAMILQFESNFDPKQAAEKTVSMSMVQSNATAKASKLNRAPSADKLKKDKTAKIEEGLFQSKSCLFQCTPKELNVFTNLIQYESGVEIDVDLLNIVKQFGYSVDQCEVQATVEAGQIVQTRQENNNLIQSEKQTELFMNNAEKHEQDAVDFIQVLVSREISRKLQQNDLAIKAADQQNQKLTREQFIKQYEEYQIKVQERDKEVKLMKMKKKEEPPPLPEFAYEKVFEDVQPELFDEQTEFQFNNQQFAHFILNLDQQYKLDLTSILLDYIKFDSKYNNEQVMLKSENNTHSELYQLFENNLFELYATMPHFTQWFNSPLIQQHLRYGDQVLLVQNFERFQIAKNKLNQQLYNYNQPIHCCATDKIVIPKQTPVLISSAPKNIFQVIYQRYGSIGAKFIEPAVVDETISKYKDLQAKLNVQAEGQVEIKPLELNNLPKPEDAAPSQRSARSGQDLKSDRSGDKKGKGKQEEIKVVEIKREKRSNAPEYNLVNFNQMFDIFHNNLTSLNIEKIQKVPLDMDTLADFEVDVPSLATEIDFKPANLADENITKINPLGINFVQHQVSNKKVTQVILNNQLGPIKVAFTGNGVEEYEVMKFAAQSASSKPVVDPKQVKQENKFKIDKKTREIDAAQQVEWRKRKKRLQDFTELSKKEIVIRNDIAKQYTEKDIKGLKAKQASLKVQIPIDGINVAINEQVVVNYADITISLTIDNRLRIEKHYCNVIPGTLRDKQFEIPIQLLNEKLQDQKKKLYFRIDFVFEIERQAMRLVCYIQEQPDSETTELVLSELTDEIYKQFQEQAQQTEVIPTIGSQIVAVNDEYYVQTAQMGVDQISFSDFLQVNRDVLVPQIEQDSRMMAWSYKNKLFSFSMFSELLQQTDYDVLLKHKKDYTSEFFFQNVVQSVYSETQSINRDSSLLAKQIKKLIKDTNFGHAMFTLPIGISGFWSENGLKVIYNQNGISDFFQLTEGQAVYRHFDQIEIGLNQQTASVSALFTEENKYYTYNLENAQMTYKFQEEQLDIQLGVPMVQAKQVQPSYTDFLPDINQIMMKGEVLPKSLIYFHESLKTNVVKEKQEENMFLFVKVLENGVQYSQAQAKENILLSCQNNELNIQKNILRDFNLCIRAQIQTVPLYRPDTMFNQIQIRRWQLETNVEEVIKFYAEQEEEVMREPARTLQQPSPLLQEEDSQLKTLTRKMTLLFYDKNEYQSYWDTPEGKLYDKDKQAYNDTLKRYDTLSQQVIEDHRIYKQPSNVTQNLVKYVINHYNKNAIPRVLKQKEYTEPVMNEIPLIQQAELNEINTFRQTQRALENQMIQDSVMNKEALACKNQDYLRLEQNALRKTKTIATMKQPFSRIVHLEPNAIEIKLSAEQLNMIREQQHQQRVDKRKKLGLQVENIVKDKKIKLYHALRITNVGTESVHVRLDKIENSAVKFLRFNQIKGCGIPPGLVVDAVVELEIDGENNVYDVIVLKTEEEILSLPVCVIVKEELAESQQNHEVEEQMHEFEQQEMEQQEGEHEEHHEEQNMDSFDFEEEK